MVFAAGGAGRKAVPGRNGTNSRRPAFDGLDKRKRRREHGDDRFVHDPADERERIRSTTAAAIESAASSGGQVMPPIMGAAAFVMAIY